MHDDRERAGIRASLLKLPPPLWAFLFLVIGGAASAASPWRALVDLRVVWLGAALVVIGVVMSVSAAALFRRAGTEIDPTSRTNRSLVVAGPFRVTRNPMYLGLVILTLGIAFCAGSLPMFAVPVLVFAVVNGAHVPFEEAKMRRQFGAEFDEYTSRVRRWI
jgi:protein-S-isoprenylcysteine O-methyltransferase Ste14